MNRSRGHCLPLSQMLWTGTRIIFLSVCAAANSVSASCTAFWRRFQSPWLVAKTCTSVFLKASFCSAAKLAKASLCFFTEAAKAASLAAYSVSHFSRSKSASSPVTTTSFVGCAARTSRTLISSPTHMLSCLIVHRQRLCDQTGDFD